MPLPSRLLVAAAVALLLAARPLPGSAAAQDAGDASGEDVMSVYVVGADGSGLVRLASEARDPAWSPDGTRIALAIGGELHTVNADGSGASRLAAIEDAYGPAWSPDGSRIAFLVERFLYVVGTDGASPMRLASAGLPLYAPPPAWSPGGERIAFASGRQCQADVGIVDADGTGPPELIDLPGGLLAGATWSPDGARIAFAGEVCGEGGTTEATGIYVVNADGSGLSGVVEWGPPAGGGDATPAPLVAYAPAAPVWSPDGAKLLFASNRGLHVVNSDGSGLTYLGAEGAIHPAWSPDGTKIAYGGWEDLFVMNADGSGARRLAGFPGSAEERPAWSPDGSRIAFVSSPNPPSVHPGAAAGFEKATARAGWRRG